MSSRWLIVTAALALAACHASDSSVPSTLPPAASATLAAQPAPAPAPASSGRAALVDEMLARYDGYGDVRFGMNEASFDQAWGGELDGAPGADAGCFYKSPKRAPPSRELGFMFEDGRFVRYDVDAAEVVAPGGGRVGMSEAQIRALYGARLQVQPHKYVEGAKYLRIAAPEGNGVLLFETDEDGKVTRWRVGVPPPVDYVEGCS